MKIAILEDNPPILDYLTTVLRMSGHTVTSFTQGAALLNSLLAGILVGNETFPVLPYDMLLVDLLLPGDLSGQDVIRATQQAIPPERLPIIIMSACSQKELDLAQSEFPTLPILRKPFKIQELQLAINSVKVC